jgi:hypothetical protein
MDTSLLQAALEHVKDHAMLYGVGSVSFIVVTVLTKRFSVPILTFLLEGSICYTIFHGVFHLLVRLTAWFKVESNLDIHSLSWKTPLAKPWEQAAYDPAALFYVEVAFLIAIFVVLWRVRPISFKKRQRTPMPGDEKKKMVQVPGYRDYSDMYDDGPSKSKSRGGKKK